LLAQGFTYLVPAAAAVPAPVVGQEPPPVVMMLEAYALEHIERLDKPNR
jgi:hypothetical protein